MGLSTPVARLPDCQPRDDGRASPAAEMLCHVGHSDTGSAHFTLGCSHPLS